MVGILTEEILPNRRLASEGTFGIPSSTGEVLSAEAEWALTRNPTPSLWRWGARQASSTSTRMLEPAEATAEFGIDKHLTFTESIPEAHARELRDLKQAELARQDVFDRAEGGLMQGTARLGVGLAVSIVDPLNIASAFIPVVGPARYALMLKQASSPAGRLAVRIGVGAAAGAVGAAAVEPLVYGVARSEQADYHAVDSMLNLAFGTVMGGGLHAGAGAVGDALSGWRKTVPGYERAIDAGVGRRLAKADMSDADRAYVGDAFESFGMADASPLVRALADAKPATREALLRAAVAHVAEARPVAVDVLARLDPAMRGEMLDVGRVVEAAEANPLGPFDAAIARLSPEGMEDILFQKGEALIQSDGSLVVQGKQHQNTLGFDASKGAVKLLVRHGPFSDKAGTPRELERADILALPKVIRELEPVPPGTGVPRKLDEQRWEVRRADGAHVRYSITRNDDGQFLVATIHVRDDGEGGPLSKRRIAPKTSPSGSSARDTAGGIAHRPPEAFGATPSGYARSERGQARRGHNPRQPHAVFDADGRRIMTRMELVEADDLVVSHHDDLTENPAFPAELQPRDRTRAASEDQIGTIVARFEPERLGVSSDAATGAPIVSLDGNVVESGNGRVLAIRRVLAAGGEDARRYLAFLADNGFDAAGMRNPVLVRRRLTELGADERRAFTVAAQKSATLDLSATERAMADARRLDGIMHLLGDDTGRVGAVTLARNSRFVRAFVELLPQADRGALLQADGALSIDGRRRIEGALLARAYDDADLLGRMLEMDDDNSRAIVGALLDVAPEWAAMRAAVGRGEISPMADATADLVAAVRAVRDARATGRPLAEILHQADMFATRSAGAEGFLKVLLRTSGDGRVRSASREAIGADLARFTDQAMKSSPTPDMFGTRPPDAQELLALLKREGLDGELRFDPDDVAASKSVERGLAESGGEAAPRAVPERRGAAPAEAADQVVDADIGRAVAAGLVARDDPDLARAAMLADVAEGDARLFDAAAFCLGRNG